MKKIICVFLALMIFSAAFTQQNILPSRTMMVNGQKLYVVSFEHLGFPKNTIAVMYHHIASYAAKKGYKLCSESIVNQIYDNYFDDPEGSAYYWLTVPTPDVGAYRILRDDRGKVMQYCSPENTYHATLNYRHAFIVLMK